MNVGDYASGFDFREAARWNQESAVTSQSCDLFTDFVHVPHGQPFTDANFRQLFPGTLVAGRHERRIQHPALHCGDSLTEEPDSIERTGLPLSGLLREVVGCFQSSEGFSQVIPDLEDSPALFCSHSAASLTAQGVGNEVNANASWAVGSSKVTKVVARDGRIRQSRHRP